MGNILQNFLMHQLQKYKVKQDSLFLSQHSFGYFQVRRPLFSLIMFSSTSQQRQSWGANTWEQVLFRTRSSLETIWLTLNVKTPWNVTAGLSYQSFLSNYGLFMNFRVKKQMCQMMKIRRFKNLCQLRLSSHLYRQKRGHNRPIYVRVDVNGSSLTPLMSTIHLQHKTQTVSL